ncbi:MAG: nitrile hydratase subunit beta [Rhizobiales bacterium NRL2]|jgi:nitrile hydratase|nr:MAG: nitrile hydratase subunit beta [Rhizobiales bacterium NRL2]
MNGVHDMGGMQGFGPIAPEPEAEEPLFHEPWERRVFALTLAAGFLGEWSIDEARHARERMNPADYLRAGYYEKWLDAVGRQMVEKGLITEAELTSGRPERKVARDEYRLLKAGTVDRVFDKGGPASLDAGRPAAFAIGDRVRALNINPAGHTRSPRYVRGHVGEVVLHHGGHVFADANAHGERRGEHLYTVRFDAKEIWGPDAFGGAVMVDLWEPHLETA